MPVVGPTKYKQDEPITPELTDDQKHELDQKLKLADKALKDAGKAKYKIELLLVRAKSTWKPTRGVLSVWESGAKLHGGGDGAVYICPGKMLGKNDCEMPIPSYANAVGRLVCPHCGSVWKSEEAYNVVIATLTMRGWATVIYKYYIALGRDADICLKHSPDDIRSVALKEKEKNYGGELLDKVRIERARSVYTLADLIKDTSAGADVLSCLHKFLTA